ncbi:MAG: sulfatase-like hydrolase/transferase, partial [Maioricimonas sp. JB049]
MLRTLMILTVLVAGRALPAFAAEEAKRPNILWIVVEDASPHIGCYGETTIATPRLDRLAEQGVRFTQAFVTSPVCSPSRSAMVSGMYQTTLGAHHHRSQRITGKGGGNTAYFDSYRVPESIRLIPELFAAAGYYVVNGGRAKTDYNFVSRGELYEGKDWAGRDEGQPFFAQIQLRGGKNRAAKVPVPVNPADVTLPAHYPDHPVLREDWARYLNSWIATDREVGEILDRLEEEGIADETAVFFWTDHGISHARGKQFLYDEG